MTAPRRRPRLRPWVVSLILFAGGFVGRLVLTAQGDVAVTYPSAVVFQWFAYGAGLLVWAAWVISEADQNRRVLPGCLLGVLLAVAFFALIATVPK